MSNQPPPFQKGSRLLASAIGVALSTLSTAPLAETVGQTDKQIKKDTSENQSSEPVALEAMSVTTQEETRGSYKVNESANRRYTAPLRETPKTVTVISEQVIKDTGSLNLVDSLRTVSGITFGAGEGGNPAGDRPIIRGFNSESDMFIDGLRDVASQTREVFNTEGIEVSKGPGSAFVGAGSTGGAINMLTKTAKQRNFADVSYTLGSDQTRRSTLDANYMVTDQVAFRLNLMKHDANVAGRNDVDVSRWGVAPTLTIGFDTPTRLTMSYYHLRTDDMPDYGLPLSQTHGTAKRRPVTGSHDRFYGFSTDYRHSNTDYGWIKIEHDLAENLVLTNSFRQVRTTLDYVVTNPDDSRGNIDNNYVYRSLKSRDSTSKGWVNQTDLRAKFNTFGIEHTMIVGAEFSYEDVHNRPYEYPDVSTINGVRGRASGAAAAGGCNASYVAQGYCTSLGDPSYKQAYPGRIVRGRAYTDTDTETAAGFMFDTLKFNDQWSLNLGVRYDDFDTKSSGVRLVSSNPQDFKFKNDTNFWSYQAGLVYNPASNGSVYFAWSTSSNPVGETSGEGSDGLAVTNADLKREKSRNWEVGTKWDFFDNRLGINAALFRTLKDNTRQLDQSGVTRNIGQTEVKGIELGVSGNITKKWEAFANYTYLDSEIKDGLNKDNHVPSTPRNSISLWSTYHLLSDLTVGGGAYYVDQRYGNAQNTTEVSSYWRYDAMAAYQVNKHLDFQLNVQNLTDKRYFDQIYPTHYAHVAPGRTALLSTNVHF
ncbi:TonB-dependent receptor [Azomonas macrocytogenes]|nr:TonB-dependent receptor [Azomonas macrocytogenes]